MTENKAKKTRRYQRIEQIMDFAESVMEVDGYHAPMLFSITDACFMIPHLIEGISNDGNGYKEDSLRHVERNRRQVASDMREILKNAGASACLFISDAWVAGIEGDDALEEMRTSGKRVRDLESRMEALSMNWEIKLEDEVVYGSRTVPYTRDKNDKIKFDKSLRVDYAGNTSGRLVGLLP